MNKIKTGLGRGLDALINPQLREEVNKTLSIPSDDIQHDDGKSYDILAKIPIKSIAPNPFQPRREFDTTAFEELKKSILENGLIQPITVRRVDGNNYELISGERRVRAFRDIGHKEIAAYIIKVDTKEGMLALSLIENIQREKLNPIEIGEAYKRLFEECNLSQEEIAAKVGKDRTTVTNSIRLLKLPEIVKQSLIKDEISAGHGRALINVPSETIQVEILKKIIKNNLSVRKVEALVKKIISTPRISKKPSKANDNELLQLVSQKDIENKIRSILGTKVICRQRKEGAGEVIIEFYSNDELERLLELFNLIENNNI